MSACLPDLLDPRKAVAQAAVFEGELSLARLPRLAAMLWRDEATGEQGEGASAHCARYRFAFGHDAESRAVVTGAVAAELPLRCQRCDQRYLLPVDVQVSLALVDGLDEANALPERYEPLLLDERLMRATDLVEDELILAVPPIPRHPESECAPPAVPGAASAVPGHAPVAAEEPAHPFAELASLKARRGDDE
jgi:uncharacterized protein